MNSWFRLFDVTNRLEITWKFRSKSNVELVVRTYVQCVWYSIKSSTQKICKIRSNVRYFKLQWVKYHTALCLLTEIAMLMESQVYQSIWRNYKFKTIVFAVSVRKINLFLLDQKAVISRPGQKKDDLLNLAHLSEFSTFICFESKWTYKLHVNLLVNAW